MWKYSLILVIVLIISACSPGAEVLATRTSITATAIAASWTMTPTSSPTPTITLTPTPSATPTPTHTPTPTPNYKETEAEATALAIKATETMAMTKLKQFREQALSVCQGNGLPAAPEWNQAMDEFNSSVICAQGKCKPPSEYFSDEKLAKWDPKEISDLHLVICEEWETTILQTCYYYPGHIAVNREREKVIFTIFAAQSGESVGRFSLTGGMPKYCPQTTILNPMLPGAIVGDKPEIVIIFQKLNSYMRLPAK